VGNDDVALSPEIESGVCVPLPRLFLDRDSPIERVRWQCYNVYIKSRSSDVTKRYG